MHWLLQLSLAIAIAATIATAQYTFSEVDANNVTHTGPVEYNFSQVDQNYTTHAGFVQAYGENDPAQGHINQDSSGHIQSRIRSGEIQARGVNLGGWLVAEQWMAKTSEIWNGLAPQIQGEFQALAYGPDREQRLAAFENHHRTFITEQDIAAIAASGLNTVRVPVGWWIVGSDPYDPSGKEEWKVFPTGDIKYLDMLIKDWALKYNVAVLVSIHAAKGSQNGADHSAAPVSNTCYWSKYKENVDNTINAAKFIGDRYKDDPAFLGIGLLNEPNGDTDEKVLNQYYMDAYRAVRASGNNCVLTIMPLLFKQDPSNLVGFMEAPEYTNVWVEWHPYFIWGYENSSPDDLVNNLISQVFDNKVSQWNNRPNANRLFFGEWCLANNGQFPSPDSDDRLSKFLKWTQAQTSVMHKVKGGWTYWNWRILDDDHDGSFNAWSMRNVLQKPDIKKMIVGQ